MEDFGAAMALSRALHITATMSVFGTLVVMWLIVPCACASTDPAARARLNADLRRLLLMSVAVAAGTGLAWVVVQAGNMAAATSLADMMQAVPIVLFGTRFGTALLVRLGLLALIAAGVMLSLGHRRPGALVVLGAVAVILQSWMGHPGAAEDNLLLGASTLHILAAAAWLGGLVPLLLVIRGAGAVGAGTAAARFSWIGILAVLLLVGTACVQGWKLIGAEGGWFGTSYGWLALAKIGLFLALLCLAAVNRFWLTPALTSGAAHDVRRHLLFSIGVESGLGLLVVLAAGTMATLTPGAHQQPAWPFPLRPNWVVTDDPDVRNAFIEAAILGVIAIGLLARAVLFARLRLVATLGAAASVWFAQGLINDAPFLDPILVEANVASYYQSPAGFAASSIADGAHLFETRCAFCHGREGRGDGPAASGLAVRPANLTEEHVWGHSDGELFWWLTDGIRSRKGEQLMPAFGKILSDDDRWALIDFLHANLARNAVTQTGSWTHPVKPPAIQAACANGDTVDLDDLRGRFVRIVAEPAGKLTQDDIDAVTILIARNPVETDACMAAGADIWAAYALVAGVTPDQLAGTTFLVDPNGWLRQRVLPAERASWTRPNRMAELVKDIEANPFAAEAAGHHHH